MQTDRHKKDGLGDNGSRPLLDSDNGCTGLLLQAQRGDTQAFAEVYGALRATVSDFVGAMDGQMCPHDREDLVQEVFLRTWRGLATFRGEASAKTFILAIARNTFRMELARRKALRASRAADAGQFAQTDSLEGAEPSDQCTSEETRKQVWQAMAKLTDTQRQAVELHQFSGLSRAQIVKLLNCSPGQFANRLHHARKRLRDMLQGLIS